MVYALLEWPCSVVCTMVEDGVEFEAECTDNPLEIWCRSP